MIHGPLLGVALRLQARRKGPDAVAKVREGLRPRRRAKFLRTVNDIADDRLDDDQLLAMAGVLDGDGDESLDAYGAPGDGSLLAMVLKFLEDHWDEIFAALLKLLS